MRITKSEDPFSVGTIDCGYCMVKFGRERCISTSVVRLRSKVDIDLLCVSIIAAGMLAGNIMGEHADNARALFEKIKKEKRK